MKILVTGGAGYIGSVTTEWLLDAGHEALVFDNLSRGHRAALDPRARFVPGDLTRAAEIAAAAADFRPDAAMHFAAFALVGESMTQPELYFGNNVIGAFHLAEALRQSGCRRLIFSSTCATYGQPEQVPILETTPQCPANPYGESKLIGEKMFRWYQERYGLECVFLRYFNACGATAKYGEDHTPETHLIPNILRVALGQAAAVEVYGDDYETPDGTCIRDYIHVSDLAQAHARALTAPHTGAFNLGNGGGYSVLEVIAAARAVTGHPLPVVRRPRRPGDPPRLVASAARAADLLGWRPQYPDIETIIRHAWAWHRAHPHGYPKEPS